MLQIVTLLVFLDSITCEKIWMFAVGGNRRPSNFIDIDGFVKGSDIDLINAVCKIARKRCEVTVQPFEECVRTIRGRIFPGVGLMDRWYDACVGYVSTPERLNSASFTAPYRKTVATFTVLKGNPMNFDPDYVSNSTIVSINGLSTNNQCLQRLSKVPKRFLIARDLDEVKAALNNGSAHALFSPRTSIAGYDVLSVRFDCTVNGGVGMMVRKDNDLPSWWNPAFQTFYQSGNYTTWCNSIHEKYGGPPQDPTLCLPPPSGQNNIPLVGGPIVG